jgi:hypothetical protein
MNTELNISLNSTLVKNDFVIDIYLMSLKMLIVLLATLLNGTLVCVYLFCVSKKTFSDYLFLSIGIADLTIGFVAMSSQALIDSLENGWPFGEISCTFFVFIQYAVPDVTAYALLSLSIHRFMQIYSPFKVKENLNLTNILMLIIPWSLTFVLWSVFLYLLISNNRFNFVICEIAVSMQFIIYKEFFVNVLTILLILVTNSFLIYLLNTKKKFKTNGFRNFQSNQNNRQKKRQNLVAHNKEKKAIYCVMAMMLSVLCTQISYVVMWPLNESQSVLSDGAIIFYKVSMWLSYCTCLTDPIIQFIFNQKIKTILKQIFLNRPLLKKIFHLKKKI